MKITKEFVEKLTVGINPYISKNIKLVIRSCQYDNPRPGIQQIDLSFEFWFGGDITRKEIESTVLKLTKAFLLEEAVGYFDIKFDKHNEMSTLVRGEFGYYIQETA